MLDGTSTLVRLEHFDSSTVATYFAYQRTPLLAAVYTATAGHVRWAGSQCLWVAHINEDLESASWAVLLL